MKVMAVPERIDWLTETLKNNGFSEQNQFDVTSSMVYEVHAIVLWSGCVVYQVLGDSGIISWIPSTLFDVIEHSLPSDWLANSLDEEVPFAIGPDFVVRDKCAYAEMVELVPEKVALFKKRLEQSC